MLFSTRSVFVLAVALLLGMATTVTAQVVISEVADKGSSGVCDGEDWLELFNSGSADVDLAGFVLHDDKGPEDEDAFTFVQAVVLTAGEYRLVCTGGDSSTTPQFRIGGDDTVTLLDAVGDVVSSLGLLDGGDSDVSYALDASTDEYSYTTTPTPGTANIFTDPETPAEIKARLKLQNDEGTRFFGMDDRGLPVADAFDQILDLHVTMAPEDLVFTLNNGAAKINKPWSSGRLMQGDQEILTLSSPGRLRPKGRSGVYFSTCLDLRSMPFQIDFDTTDSSQTLFGVQRAYLRNHFFDNSYMRDYASHRMLARFGLPHLRARKVRFYINEELMG